MSSQSSAEDIQLRDALDQRANLIAERSTHQGEIERLGGLRGELSAEIARIEGVIGGTMKAKGLALVVYRGIGVRLHSIAGGPVFDPAHIIMEESDDPSA